MTKLSVPRKQMSLVSRKKLNDFFKVSSVSRKKEYFLDVQLTFHPGNVLGIFCFSKIVPGGTL